MALQRSLMAQRATGYFSVDCSLHGCNGLAAACLCICLCFGLGSGGVARAQTQPQPIGNSPLKSAVTATADTLSGSPENSVHFRGAVELKQNDLNLRAPEVDYNVLTDEVQARGGAVLIKNKDVLRTPSLTMKLGLASGVAQTPEFFLAKNNARGNAAKLEMSEWRTQTLTDVNYTSCRPGQNDWILKADRMVLDENSETGSAHGAVLRFFDVPIFALPYFEFPIGHERRSGVLPASFGINSVSGYELSLPYYVNLAHNMDLTLTTRLMTKRGLQVSANARYLGQALSGDARLDWLGNDWLKHAKRWGVFSHHQFKNGAWSAGANLERVSDNAFFADLSRSATAAAQTSLPMELWARYAAPWGELNVRASRYQTLQDANQSIVPAYERLPVINWIVNPLNLMSNSGANASSGIKFESAAQITRFNHPTLIQGNRLYAQPQLSYDFKQDWGFFNPKLALNGAYYSQLNGPTYTGAASFTRAMPMLSLDSGATFERQGSWFGKAATQTLEPRLFFLYVPFKDQAHVPLFDTAQSGFSFAQIFSNNVFTGQDRIADAKHITPALTQRWLDQASGAELFKATLGKRYYFAPQRVQLTGASLTVNPNQPTTSSDWLFAAQGALVSDISLDTALQYDQAKKTVVNSAYTLRYNPSQRQVLTASKRFTKDTQNAVDLSWQWRVTPNSAILGRWAYSLGVKAANLPQGTSETLLGYEYDAGCWTFRVAANRYTTTANTKATNLYLHLEFSGLTHVGSGSIETLKRNIPSYQPFESKPNWTYDPFRSF